MQSSIGLPGKGDQGSKNDNILAEVSFLLAVMTPGFGMRLPAKPSKSSCTDLLEESSF